MNCYLNSQDQWLLILESCKSCLAEIEARLLIFLKVAHKQNEFNTCVIVMIEEFRLFHQTIVVEYPSQCNWFFLFSLLLRELDEGPTWMWNGIFEAHFGCCLCRLLLKYKNTNTTTTTTKTMIEIHSLAPKMKGIYIKEIRRDSRIISFVPLRLGATCLF